MAAVARPRAGAATLTVDLGAVAANTRLLAGRATGELMAVVKADGFGHGAVDVARAALAAGATRLGVTSLAEAVALREAGCTAPVLSWLNPPDGDYSAAAAYDIEVGVPSRQHLHAVAQLAPGARVHLMLDTGMAREGAAPANWPELCRAARFLERQGRIRVVGVMGHLSCADRPADPSNAAARARFAWGVRLARAAGLRPRDRHLAATAATLTDPQSHHTMSRVGAGLVGIDPSGTTRLRPAMTLTAPVIETRQVRAGTPVGYGASWSAPRATTLGLLPLGYADGLPRHASGRAEVLIRGRRRPVVGQISMDMTVIDLGDEPVHPGEVATVFGPGDAGEPTAAEWAAWAATIEHDIVTGLGQRLHRRVAAAAGRPVLRSLR
ncbi:MAG: alanine racemase [Micromonosporaceae bacterium]|nr:alanine racemase [Micromonosporaceae bacterium]